MYQLSLPSPPATTLGGEPAFLMPHEGQYEMLADGLGLEVDTVFAVAANYAANESAALPDEEPVRAALKAVHLQHAYPSERISASRAAFGRVLADFSDARLLENAPPQVHRRLRTVDVDLLALAAQSRPTEIPRAPEAGHDQTLDRWGREIEERIASYISSATNGDRILIGARVRLTVLNWDHLEEEFICGAVVGTEYAERLLARRDLMLLSDLAETSAARQPRNGDPLVLENTGHAFHQISADWLSFRPEFAAALGWIADRGRQWCWRTATGDIAVETIWWVDGWWGRAGRAFDDTEADGYAVVLTPTGLDEVRNAFGAVSLHLRLTRYGRRDAPDGPRAVVTRTIPLAM
jgi:hypothetical protein